MEQGCVASLLPPEKQERVASYLGRLSSDPPYCLLLEGGSKEQRKQLALYWCALLNCTQGDRPCGRCRECAQIASGIFRELYWLNGEQGAIKIEEVRTFRRYMAERMSQGSVRVFVLHEAQELTPSAANGLLKSLEEPLPGNVFLLLAPQRSLLLPTLVSRSYLFTLGWLPSQEEQSEAAASWIARLLQFWKTGEGLFEYTGQKGALDKDLVREILLALQKRLLQAMLGESKDQCAVFLQEKLGLEARMRLQEGLDKAIHSLQHQVNPSLVLDWIGLEVWSRIPTGSKKQGP